MIQFVRKLNKPYKRSDFVIEGFCMIIDGIVHIISFGYVRTGLQIWCINKKLDRMLSHLQDEIKNEGN
jgi:hypothetical protein